MIFSSVSDFVKTLIDRKSPMIQSFSIFNGNNFPESYLSKVFTLSSNLSYVAAPGTARHCYVETVTLRLARSQQNIVTERRCEVRSQVNTLRSEATTPGSIGPLVSCTSPIVPDTAHVLSRLVTG